MNPLAVLLGSLYEIHFSVFFSGIPRTSSLSGKSLYVSIVLSVLGILALIPVLIVLPTWLSKMICKACGKKVIIPFLQMFKLETFGNTSNSDSFIFYPTIREYTHKAHAAVSNFYSVFTNCIR